ncbi:MAG: hypothetical protein ACOX5W_02570 [Bacillota bacterium]|jgi:ArsR family transcriptional regulator
MCQQDSICLHPEKLQGKPGECSPEQIEECHGKGNTCTCQQKEE